MIYIKKRKRKKKKPAKHIILSHLMYKIIQYQVCEGCHNEKVLKLTEQPLFPKFVNAFIYLAIYEKIVKKQSIDLQHVIYIYIYYQLPISAPTQ